MAEACGPDCMNASPQTVRTSHRENSMLSKECDCMQDQKTNVTRTTFAPFKCWSGPTHTTPAQPDGRK